MKIGIIGAGTIGEKHASAAQAAGDEIAWVVDADTDRGQAFADKFGGKSCETPVQLWDDDSVAAVVIGVPNWLHLDFALQALESGKDVLLEKPMALNLDECQQIAHRAEELGRIVQIGFVHRYTGVAKVAKDLAVAKVLGDIYSSRASLCLGRGVPGLGRWFTNKEFSGGGALIDVGVHLIDLAMHILGFPEVIDVRGQTFQNFGAPIEDYRYEEMWAGPPDPQGVCNVEDSAQALIRFANGGVLDLHIAWAGNYPRKHIPVSLMSFLGTKGGMTFELFGNEVQHALEEAGQIKEKSIPAEDNDFFLDQFLDFKRSIESRSVFQADHNQGCEVQAIVDAIYNSSRKASSMTSELSRTGIE